MVTIQKHVPAVSVSKHASSKPQRGFESHYLPETEQPADNVVAQLKGACNNNCGDTSCLHRDGDKGINAVHEHK